MNSADDILLDAVVSILRALLIALIVGAAVATYIWAAGKPSRPEACEGLTAAECAAKAQMGLR